MNDAGAMSLTTTGEAPTTTGLGGTDDGTAR